MADLISNQNKIEVKNKEFILEDKDAALILAIQELTSQIRRLASK